MTDIFHQPSYPPRSASAPVWGYAASPTRVDRSSAPAVLNQAPTLGACAPLLDTRQASLPVQQAAVAGLPGQVVPFLSSQIYAELMHRATKDLEDCRQFLAQSQSCRERWLQALTAKPEGKGQSIQDCIDKLALAEARRRAVSQAKVMQALQPILEALDRFNEACQLTGQALCLSEWGAPVIKEEALSSYLAMARLVDQCDERLPQGLEVWLNQTAQCAADLGLSADCQETLAQAKAKLPQNSIYWRLHQSCRRFFSDRQQDAQ